MVNYPNFPKSLFFINSILNCYKLRCFSYNYEILLYISSFENGTVFNLIHIDFISIVRIWDT